MAKHSPSAPDGHPAPAAAARTVQAPKAVGKAPIAPGTPPQADEPPLPLPHERDESVGDVAHAPDPVIVQAARDIAAGQVDTDMRSTGGQTQARRDALLRKERG
jgi:hypothetical protein